MRSSPIVTKFQKDNQEIKKVRSDGWIFKQRPYNQKSGKGSSSQFICYSLLLVGFLLKLKHVVYLSVNSHSGFRRKPVLDD